MVFISIRGVIFKWDHPYGMIYRDYEYVLYGMINGMIYRHIVYIYICVCIELPYIREDNMHTVKKNNQGFN